MPKRAHFDFVGPNTRRYFKQKANKRFRKYTKQAINNFVKQMDIENLDRKLPVRIEQVSDRTWVC